MKIRVGMAGYSRSGCDIHVRWLRNAQKQFKIVAVADQLPERLEDARNEWGCAVYEDYKELLKEQRDNIDLFINAMPSHLHVKGTVAALKAGLPVVCEKPLGRTTKEFDVMAAASKKAGKPLFAFQNARFHPFFQKVRSIVDSGVIGEVLHIRMCWGGFSRRWDWQTQQKYYGGNLLNTGPHPMDFAVCFLDGAKPKVCCQMKSIQPFGGDAEDYCNITMYGKNIPTIEVVLSNYMAYPTGDLINIQGSLGGLSGNYNAIQWKYYDPAKAPQHELWQRWSENCQFCSEKLRMVQKSWKVRKADEDVMQATSRRFYQNVYDVLNNRAEQAVTLAQVRRQIELIEECHKQNRLPKRCK